MYRTDVGKLLYMYVPGACSHHAQRQGKRKERSLVPQSDEMNVKRIARYLKVPNEKCVIEINRLPPFVNVHPHSDQAGQRQTSKSTRAGATQWRSTTRSA